MKAFTDIEQSKKLIELGLNADTADMHYSKWDNDENEEYHLNCGELPKLKFKYATNIPAWSLSALLSILSRGTRLLKSATDETYYIDSPNCNTNKWYDNPIDSCVELIENLHNKMVYDFNN